MVRGTVGLAGEAVSGGTVRVAVIRVLKYVSKTISRIAGAALVSLEL